MKLFLASPNDVVRERKIAEDVIAAINRDFSDHTNCTVELLAWEHVQPGAGRPQERINLCVDQCDLFVGILWKRWGSPAGNGQTGFEEEFERASRIQHSVGSPDLWIFFKDVDAESSEDPGQQLRQVLAFRRRLESEQQVLYKNFANEIDFHGKFHTHLLRHLFTLQREKPHGARENHALSPVFPPREDPAAHTADSTSIVRSMLNSIPSQLGAQPAQFVGRDPLGAVRLLVFASALHYSAVRPHLLSNHAVNTAYAFRDRITLTEFEKIHLFTSMIREGNRHTPGWFWVRDGGSVGIFERLYTLATEDHEPDTRKAAVEYLTKQRKIAVLGRTADEVALKFLQDNSEDVKRVAIEYAATLGSDALIQKLEELRGDPTLTMEADSAVASIKVRTNPREEVLELLRSGTEAAGVVMEALRPAARELDEAWLCKALKHAHPDVRHVGATALLERGLISEWTAKELVEDRSRDVVAVGIQALIERGEAPSAERIGELLDGSDTGSSSTSGLERDKLVQKSFEKMSSEELNRQVGWLSVDGPAAYEVVGKREFAERASDIRRDLETRFTGLKERDIEALRKVVLEGVREGLGNRVDEAAKAVAEEAAESTFKELVSKWAKLDGFVNGRFAAAGLRVLEECGNRGDLELARFYTESEEEEVRGVVVELLRKWGNGSDVEWLVASAKASIGAMSEKAGRAAIELSGNSRQLVGRFLCSESPGLAEAALGMLEADGSLELPEECEQLLETDSPMVRSGLTRILVGRWNRNDVRDLLDRYIGRGIYYYDVVAALDRALYGPGRKG